MGTLKKHLGAYSVESSQLGENYTNSTNLSYIQCKATDGTALSSTYIVKNNAGTAWNYANTFSMHGQVPVATADKYSESATGSTYDNSKTYYTDKACTTEADMSGYSDGDTITDTVYALIFDVNDYQITGVGTTSYVMSRTLTATQAKLIYNVTVTNSGSDDIEISCIRFKKFFIKESSGTAKDVLCFSYYLDSPVTIAPGTNKVFSVEFNITVGS